MTILEEVAGTAPLHEFLAREAASAVVTTGAFCSEQLTTEVNRLLAEAQHLRNCAAATEDPAEQERLAGLAFHCRMTALKTRRAIALLDEVCVDLSATGCSPAARGRAA